MIEPLANRYKWAPGFWRSLGWRELQAWIRTAAEAMRREARAGHTDAESWAGREDDAWWAEQNRKARGG